MAAHYENTILITEKEPEILTILKKIMYNVIVIISKWKNCGKFTEI